MKQALNHYALFGNPVGHSLSPLMLNAAFGAMGIRARYEAHCVENLELSIRMIREKPLAGVSVTLPMKGAVMDFLDEVDEDARAIGAVNTIKNEGGRLRGSNTDWTGLTAAMREQFPLEGKTVAVLCAGGAAAAVYGILREGRHSHCLCPPPRQGRIPGEMVRVRRAAAGPSGHGGGRGAHQRNPVGMRPLMDETPVDRRHLPRFRWVVETIYNPLETRLLREARAAGCGVITGLSMFVRQGAEQIRIWTGLEPPVELMSRVVKTTFEENRVERRGTSHKGQHPTDPSLSA